MTQIVVDIRKTTEQEKTDYFLLQPYRVTAYVYETENLIQYGASEEDVLNIKIGEITKD